jgi:hypothetical protein
MVSLMAYFKISITFSAESIFNSVREFLHRCPLQEFGSSRTPT